MPVLVTTPSNHWRRALQEHRIYPQAIRSLCNGYVKLDENEQSRWLLEQPAPTLISPALD